ncbi:hypothetical protein M3Y99_00843600 [Aphelenchoides fujianensis]|nr:hypothetical protein M3Y99_00843600 [Aphelenchoides fujianensis]
MMQPLPAHYSELFLSSLLFTSFIQLPNRSAWRKGNLTAYRSDQIEDVTWAFHYHALTNRLRAEAGQSTGGGPRA